MRNLREAELKGKRVFYHPDYSVPMEDGVIKDDYRIIATFPTLDFLIEQGAKIIICTKIGDPKGQVVPELDTRPVAERLADEYPDHTIRLAHDLFAPEVEQAMSEMEEGDILMLPNIRFYPEEQKSDPEFGKKLAALGDLYVNDAFSLDHRGDASITQVPKHIPAYPGFSLESELMNLGNLMEAPEKPFVVIMGGAKVSDKIEVIKVLANKADKLLIGGAMANTFLLAKGEEIGASKAEADKVDLAKSLMEEFGDKLVLAPDYVKDDDKSANFKYLDVGPETIELFKKELSTAKTIFWNGSLGYTEDSRFAKASEEITRYIGSLKDVTSVVAGGDTVEMITRLKLHDQFTFVSTGGGAALEFLAGNRLPGVDALEEGEEEAAEEPVEEKVEKEAPKMEEPEAKEEKPAEEVAVEEKEVEKPEPVKEEEAKKEAPKEEVKEVEKTEEKEPVEKEESK